MRGYLPKGFVLPWSVVVIITFTTAVLNARGWYRNWLMSVINFAILWNMTRCQGLQRIPLCCIWRILFVYNPQLFQCNLPDVFCAEGGKILYVYKIIRVLCYVLRHLCPANIMTSAILEEYIYWIFWANKWLHILQLTKKTILHNNLQQAQQVYDYLQTINLIW